MARGKYRRKVTRGGPKKFSQDLKPLDKNELERDPDPNNWRERGGDDDDSDEDSDEEESSEEDESDIEDKTPDLVIGGQDNEDKFSSRQADVEGMRKSKRAAAAAAAAAADEGNLNRAQKSNISASELGTKDPREMTRKEKEAMDKQQAKARYWKLHEQGKTEQAQADLKRLALIRKEREEKAKVRQAELEDKQQQQAAKSQTQGRRS